MSNRYLHQHSPHPRVEVVVCVLLTSDKDNECFIFPDKGNSCVFFNPITKPRPGMVTVRGRGRGAGLGTPAHH